METLMAEGEVQQTINEIREAADTLSELDLNEIVAGLQAAASRLNDLLSDGGATSEQDEEAAPEEADVDVVSDESE
jgi:hypothetical protein